MTAQCPRDPLLGDPGQVGLPRGADAAPTSTPRNLRAANAHITGKTLIDDRESFKELDDTIRFL